MKKILVIEDNREEWQFIERFFNKAGFKIIEFVDNGREGLQKVETDSFDLVIVDTKLPDTDGFEVCSKIKRKQIEDRPRIILMTGFMDAVDASRARKIGVDEYCMKSADYYCLVKIAQELLEKE